MEYFKALKLALTWLPCFLLHFTSGWQVNVHVRLLANGTTWSFNLNNTTVLDALKRSLVQFPTSAKLKISSQSGKTLTTLRLVRNINSDNGFQDDKTLSMCYFKQLRRKDNFIIRAVDLCQGVEGVIEIHGKPYHIKPVTDKPAVTYKLLAQDNQNNVMNKKRKRRAAEKLRPPARHNSSTRYIEVYIAVDQRFYNRTNSIDDTQTQIINLINYANTLYQPLDIYLALVKVDVWSNGDKFDYPWVEVNSSRVGVDSRETLGKFCTYRANNINPTTSNDIGILITGIKLHSPTSKIEGGVAYTGRICSHLYSCALISHSQAYPLSNKYVALAHEVGHSLGLPHIDKQSRCRCVTKDTLKPKMCVMYATHSSIPGEVDWSVCSRIMISNGFRRNLDQCLKNVPEVLMVSSSGSVCGNYFVENDEECDCGPADKCTNRCCNPETCRLAANSSCATGRCCNLENCEVLPEGTVCQPLRNAQCDVAERCDGISPWCPADVYQPDGTPCYNKENAYCYKGECNSHSSQCMFILRRSGARRSAGICYKANNNGSSPYGNCGWSWELDKNLQKYKKIYHKCQTKEDHFCGLLHCQYRWAYWFHFPSPYIANSLYNIYVSTLGSDACAISSFDVGFNSYDPGQIPNGAKCGENKMCVNSRCLEIPLIENTSAGFRSTPAALTSRASVPVISVYSTSIVTTQATATTSVVVTSTSKTKTAPSSFSLTYHSLTSATSTLSFNDVITTLGSMATITESASYFVVPVMIIAGFITVALIVAGVFAFSGRRHRVRNQPPYDHAADLQTGNAQIAGKRKDGDKTASYGSDSAVEVGYSGT